MESNEYKNIIICHVHDSIESQKAVVTLKDLGIAAMSVPSDGGVSSVPGIQQGLGENTFGYDIIVPEENAEKAIDILVGIGVIALDEEKDAYTEYMSEENTKKRIITRIALFILSIAALTTFVAGADFLINWVKGLF